MATLKVTPRAIVATVGVTDNPESLTTSKVTLTPTLNFLGLPVGHALI